MNFIKVPSAKSIIQKLILLNLLALAAGQILKLPTGSNSISIYFHDISLVVLWFFYLVTARKNPFSTSTPLTKPIIIFIATMLLSLVASLFIYQPSEVVVGFFYLVRFILYTGLFFITYSYLDNRFSSILQDFVVIAALVVAVLGLLQLIFIPDFTFMAQFGWDPHYGRMVSTFFDPNFSGGLLSLIFIPTMAMFLTAKSNRLAILLSLVIIYTALSQTYSRSSYLAFSFSMVIFSYILKSWKVALASLIMIVSLLALTFPRQQLETNRGIDRQVSARARLSSWQQGLTIVRDYPILGIGFNNYRLAQKHYGFLSAAEIDRHSGSGNDSGLMFVLATGGIVGFLAYAYLLFSIFKLCFMGLPNNILKLAVGCGLVGLLVHGQFVNSMFFVPIVGVIWLLLAQVAYYKESNGRLK